jgi:hypothetical protein
MLEARELRGVQSPHVVSLRAHAAFDVRPVAFRLLATRRTLLGCRPEARE